MSTGGRNSLNDLYKRMGEQGNHEEIMGEFDHANMQRNLSRSFRQKGEKKQGDATWRKVIRPGCLAMVLVFIMFGLFFCNLATFNPRIRESIVWNAPVFRRSPQNCTHAHLELQQSLTPAERVLVVNEALKPGDSEEDIDEDNKATTEPPTKPSTGHPCRREGTESLPTGIVESYTDLERRHLWKAPVKDGEVPQNLLAMAIGLKQNKTVDKIINKFPASNFTLMLFHYDGNVDGWADMEWNSRAIHIMAFNQTKWWFAKRFLHPDVVQRYNYMFLWDEDLGVENFNSGRYLDIMEEEGLEISQPALHQKSGLHHRLTRRKRDTQAHKRIITWAGNQQCDAESTGPPCTGWVEMMAPVFSRAAWRCAWHMIQNDLVHGWGMDYKLGYCAQGTRSEKVGVIDAEFVIHEGIPSLGGPPHKRGVDAGFNQRQEVLKRATEDMDIFSRRWRSAASNDKNWQDPYAQPVENTTNVKSEKYPVSSPSGFAAEKLLNDPKAKSQNQQLTPTKTIN